MAGQDPERAPPEEVRDLAERRAAARKARDFAAADQLRARIGELGWVVTDSATGFSLVPADAAGGQSGTTASAGYQVLSDPGAVAARPRSGPVDRSATVGLLVEGWPDDLRECVAALLEHAPPDVKICGLDTGNVDGAGDVLHELATAHPGRIEEWHTAAGAGWGQGRNALLRADPGPVHVLMETSTILTGDAISPLLAELANPRVVAAGWRGADPDPDLRAFHDAGPGPVTALLGYLMAVRTEVADRVGGLWDRARFYRNADLEFSLRLGREGELIVPSLPLPVRQARHRGYHDSDPSYRDAQSLRNYRRVLDLLRGLS